MGTIDLGMGRCQMGNAAQRQQTQALRPTWQRDSDSTEE